MRGRATNASTKDTARPLSYYRALAPTLLLRAGLSLLHEFPRRTLLGNPVNKPAYLRPGTAYLCGRMDMGFRECVLAETGLPISGRIANLTTQRPLWTAPTPSLLRAPRRRRVTSSSPAHAPATAPRSRPPAPRCRARGSRRAQRHSAAQRPGRAADRT